MIKSTIVIQPDMMQQIMWLLIKFPKEEWSGPAWYVVTEESEKGFPERVELVHFKPLHLGSGGSTEWEGAVLGEKYPQIFQAHPEIEGAHQGHIHSHHTMGAYFSSTDKEAMRDHARENGFFFSLVVSSKESKQFAFGLSYKDQFDMVNVLDEQQIALEVPDELNDDIAFIQKQAKEEKAKKKKATVYTSNHQRRVWNNKKQSYEWVDYKPKQLEVNYGQAYNAKDADKMLDDFADGEYDWALRELNKGRMKAVDVIKHMQRYSFDVTLTDVKKDAEALDMEPAKEKL